MSSSALTIDHFSATLRLDAPEDPNTRTRFAQIVDEVARNRLAPAVGEVELGEGHWCVRRIDVPLVLDDTGDAPLGVRWATQLAEALAQVVRTRPEDAIHFARDVDVVTDLVAALALGSSTRAWAWHQAGALRAPVVTDPRRAALDALSTRPRVAAAAVIGAVARIGLVRVERLLGTAGVVEAGDAVLRSYGAAVPVTPTDPAGSIRWNPRVAAIARRSSLAKALLASGLRIDDTRASAWGVLVVAEAEPAALARREAGALLAGVARRLTVDGTVARSASGLPPVGSAPALSGQAGSAADVPPARGETLDELASRPLPADEDVQRVEVEPQVGPERASERVAAGVVTRPPHDERVSGNEPVPGTEPELAAGAPTRWGGLLFLLATAAAAGLPDRALDDPCLTDLPLAVVMHQVATRLAPVPPDDPAALTLAGLSCGCAADLVPGTELSPAVQGRLDELAKTWATTTLARLAACNPGERWTRALVAVDPAAALADVFRRPARVVAEPGWVDVHFDVASVDVDVRKAGLDLDPGWVPWLGLVVRYRYD